jgi:uncharacterized RDD family membrane protein YckC
MAQDSARRTIRVGYEQFVPPPVPPGMYFDRDVWLVLPEGVRRAGKGRVAASWFLGVGLFIATAGIGYLVSGMVVWGRGHTPAQRMLGLRCWQPGTGRVADRRHMALRQITGLLNGELAIGPIIWLTSKSMNSLGDFFAGTVVLHDPNRVLHR